MSSEVIMGDNLDNNVDYWKDEPEEPVYYSDSVSLSTVSTQDTEVNKGFTKKSVYINIRRRFRGDQGQREPLISYSPRYIT